MKNIKIKNKLVVMIIAILIGIINCCNVYATEKDPSSSKGFADYDDITAAEENEKLIEEQEREINDIKSTNNYLENLQVEGYTISPEFEKQTMEYTLTEQVEVEEINIIAIASDEKALIEGVGITKLKTGKHQYRIDVTAESGTVRTYIINIEKTEKTENTEKSDNIIENSTQEVIQYENTTVNSYTPIYLIFAIVVIVCIILLKIRITKNK